MGTSQIVGRRLNKQASCRYWLGNEIEDQFAAIEQDRIGLMK